MTNVIQDPGFEAGIGSWRCSRGTTVGTVTHETTIVHSGTGAARMTRSATVDTGTFNFRQVNTRYPTKGGDRWSGRIWVYNGAAATHAMTASLIWRDAGGTETFIFGPSVTPPLNTWTQLTMPSTVMPATAVDVVFQANGGTNYAPNEFLVFDDVYLAQGALLDVSSLAATSGYGWWRFAITTDPPFGEGTGYSLTPYPSATPIAGALTDGGDDFKDLLINNLVEETYTASVDVTGAGTARDTWSFERLTFTQTDVQGQQLTMAANWAPKQGGENGSDATVNWGDGSPTQDLLQTVAATGTVMATHLYPVTAEPVTYTLTLRSGAYEISHQVTISSATRSAITTSDGSQRVYVDIQEWPQFTFPRQSAVLAVQGREEPIVLTDVVRLPSTQITFLARTAEESSALLQILKAPGRLNVSSPCPGVESIWMIVLGIERVRLTNRGTEVRRLVVVDAQQVNAP